MARRSIAGLALLFTLGFGNNPNAQDRSRPEPEPIVGLPCEGCEAVFQGRPKTLSFMSRIAPPDEPGSPLRIEGVVRHPNGRPAPGIIVYAYQTDAQGIYPPPLEPQGRASKRHGKLRGWVKTDAGGRYRFETIRPGSYPGTQIPQHIHMHVIESDRCTYYIDDVAFTDDPHLTSKQLRQMTRGRGGPGVATPKQDSDGVWLVTRDISLGEKIPGYSRCGQPES